MVADHHVGDAYTDMRRTRVTTEPVFEAAPEPAGAYERVFGGQGTGPEYTLEEDPRATVDHDPDDYSHRSRERDMTTLRWRQEPSDTPTSLVEYPPN